MLITLRIDTIPGGAFVIRQRLSSVKWLSVSLTFGSKRVAIHHVEETYKVQLDEITKSLAMSGSMFDVEVRE